MDFVEIIVILIILGFLAMVIYKKNTKTIKITARILKLFEASIELENEKGLDESPTKKDAQA